MKRVLSKIGQVLCILLVLFSVGVLIFTIVSVRTIGERSMLFGYRLDTVLSDSMSDTFQAGDVVISKSVDPQTLQVGDIITFSSIDPGAYGEVFAHKIRAITTYEGEPAFVTYGTTTGVDDSYPVPFENVIGQYVRTIPDLGEFLLYFKTPQGYFTVILIPFLLLLLVQLVYFVKLFKSYQQDKREEAQREQQETEAQLRAELEQLRAQVGAQHAEDQEQDQEVMTK